MKKFVVVSVVVLIVVALGVNLIEIRQFKAAWAREIAAKDKTLLKMQASLTVISERHDPVIEQLRVEIAALKMTNTALANKIALIRVPSAAEVVALAEDVALSCDERLAATVNSFTLCTTASETKSQLITSLNTENERLTALDVEQSAKVASLTAVSSTCFKNYEALKAQLLLAQRKNSWLIVYAGVGGSVDASGKVHPSAQIGVGVKIKGLL
jgi:hypothetical protein